jgi:PiT family inorganic phosphate transporter
MTLDPSLTAGTLALLGLSLAIVCGFEFVNGFHDTANAVATVIYTRSMKPWAAVIWSGTCNFCGVFVGGIAVAMSILKLLPVELLVSSGTGDGLAMVFALLLAAIAWNLGTWYLGLPASSSHTLIGAILGVGLASSTLPGHVFGSGINWTKAAEVGLSLLISPLLGFSVAGWLVWVASRVKALQGLDRSPTGSETPPSWIRLTLVATCTGVSFAHGSNDGQKGVGLVMLILIGLVPAQYALNPRFGAEPIAQAIAATREVDTLVGASADRDHLHGELEAIRTALGGRSSLNEVPREGRWELRRLVLLADSEIGAFDKAGSLHLTDAQALSLKQARASIRGMTDYAPSWVLVMIALSLGVGTMIGWKRIVVTVGEKIGKQHLTYGQGASAELVAMTTIGLSALAGLPVSTTHVLSSGIAGTMVARRAGLQGTTVRNIALAWLLTLPASTLLAGILFLVLRRVL